MNEKVTLHYLIEALTKRHQMEPKDADTFVKAFFELIRRALERDKYIKIKGLGTFKRIETVTGDGEEDIVGQSRFRITFTPDVSMRDLINRPFSHFETVVLNEHTHFADMDEEDAGELPDKEEAEDISDDIPECVKPSLEPMNPEQPDMTTDKDAVVTEEDAEKAQLKYESSENVGTGIEESAQEEQLTVSSVEADVAVCEAESDEMREKEPSSAFGELSAMDEETVEQVSQVVTASDMVRNDIPKQMVTAEKIQGNSVGPDTPMEETEYAGTSIEKDDALPSEDMVPGDETVAVSEELLDQESQSDKRIDSVEQDITPHLPESVAGESDKKIQKGERRRIPWCMYATILLVGVLIGGGVIWALLSGRRYIPESLLRELISEKKMGTEISCTKALDKKKVLENTSHMDSVKQLQDSTPKKKPAKLTLPTVELPAATPEAKVVPVKKEIVPAQKRETLADTMEYTITGTLDTYTLQNGESLVKVALKYYGNKKLWPYIVRHNRKIIKNPDNVPVGTVLLIPKLSPKK